MVPDSSAREAALSDEDFGDVSIVYEEHIEDYMVNASFRKAGDTQLILTAPDGSRRVFDLKVEKSRYDIREAEEP